MTKIKCLELLEMLREVILSDRVLEYKAGGGWMRSDFQKNNLNLGSISCSLMYRLQPIYTKRLITWQELIDEGLPLLIKFQNADICTIMVISPYIGIIIDPTHRYSAVKELVDAGTLRSHDGGKTWKDWTITSNES